MIFRENHLLADDSHKISYLFFFFFLKIRKMLQKLPSAAVVIGALRVKKHHLFDVSLASFVYWVQSFGPGPPH